jgi:hypothetical protein
VFYHNNFVNNVQQASSTAACSWDNGLEGNYWSNYPAGLDGDHNGIGDAPWVIASGNTDHFPLLGLFHSYHTLFGPVTVSSNSSIAAFAWSKTPANLSVRLWVANMSTTQTTGFCRVAIPHALMTAPYTPLVNGSTPDYVDDAIHDNGTHRWLYLRYSHSLLDVVINGTDTTPPTVTVLTPENRSYNIAELPLQFTVSELPAWTGYSLDGQANVTTSGNDTLTGLADGLHSVVVYANDTVGNMGASAPVNFTVDTTAPVISLFFPANVTYTVNALPLNFTINEVAVWKGYSLDGQANVTIDENTTLTDLADGLHSIVLYANDSVGNMGASSPVSFTVDTVAPTVAILSPDSVTYTSADVPLTFTVSDGVSWMGYALDLTANVTIGGNTTLLGLSDGGHQVTVYANDTVGNMGHSSTVFFTVDTLAPVVVMLSPENETYPSPDVPLTFTVSNGVSWMGYSLDGQANVTVGGNMTLTGLADGLHSVVVYANDTVGNMGASNLVAFTVNVTAPVIVIWSPASVTYANADIPLTFTVSSGVAWMGYSLDGQLNVTLTGNTTLTGLPDGLHTVVVYANDSWGNMGASAVVSFTVDTAPPEISGVVQAPPQGNVWPGDVVHVNATVVDGVSGVQRVLLNYTADNATLMLVDMLNVAGDVWSASIPTFPAGTTVIYMVVAEDAVGNTISTVELGYEDRYDVIPEFGSLALLLALLGVVMLTLVWSTRNRRVP